MTDLGYTTRYRPKTWDEFIGNEPIVKSLRASLQDNTSHNFLFIGDSGYGKTTLARLAARQVGATEFDILEIDGATHNGIDDMREITQSLNFHPLGKVKAIILDECQAVTSQAWKSLLKSIEEPPSWVYWFFCTTEGGKVPTAVKTRCIVYELKPVTTEQLRKLLDRVIKNEDLEIDESIIKTCIDNSEGSSRKALSHLAACHSITLVSEARELLKVVDENSPGAIELARSLVKSPRWSNILPILKSLKDENPESVRHILRAYVTNVILGTTNEAIVCQLMPLLDELLQPLNYHDGISPIVAVVAHYLFNRPIS